MTSKHTAWLAGLKAGDEVAVGMSFERVAAVTPKQIRLHDGMRFNRETGEQLGPAKEFERVSRARLRQAMGLRRHQRRGLIQAAIGTWYSPCPLSDEALAALGVTLSQHGVTVPKELLP